MKMKKTLLITIVVSLMISLIPTISSAEEEVVLTVYNGSNIVKTFTAAEIDTLAASEGNKNYDYSGKNRFSSDKNSLNSQGPTVNKILETADQKYSLDNLSGNTRIKFVGTDGMMAYLTVEQLKEDRYYYPNGNKETGKGSSGGESAVENKVLVPAIIEKKDNGATLRFGQVSPNEQTWPAHIQYISDGGKIVIENTKASKISKLVSTSAYGRSSVVPGEVIALKSSKMSTFKTYYTTDGTTPTMASDIYNYNTYSIPNICRTIKAPSTTGSKITIKCFSTWFGYLKSDVQTFTYTVKSLPVKNKTYTVGRYKYKITKSAKTGGTVVLTGMAKKTYTSATVPKTVTINGYKFNVTSIGTKALYKNKKIKKITVYSTNIKSVGKYAFKGIYKKAKIKVPSKKLTTYKRLFKNKGQEKAVKIVKL